MPTTQRKNALSAVIETAKKEDNEKSKETSSTIIKNLSDGDNDHPSRSRIENPSDIATVVKHVWSDEQLAWFRNVFRKDIMGFALYWIVWGLYTYYTPSTLSAKQLSNAEDGSYMSAQSRMILTVIFAIVAWLTIYIDIIHGTKPIRGDNKWHLLEDGLGGHFSYLTVNILTAWVVYWTASAVGEIAWYTGDIHNYPFLNQLLSGAYLFSVFSSTLGTILTLLFLKFNWYEPNWRKNVLQMYLDRGETSFVTKILFTHINQLPIAVIDVLFLKHKHLLAELTPSILNLMLANLIYCSLYIFWTHANFNSNGGYYPYPIFDVVLKSWSIEIPFVGGIAAFCFLICVVFHYIATLHDQILEYFYTS